MPTRSATAVELGAFGGEKDAVERKGHGLVPGSQRVARMLEADIASTRTSKMEMTICAPSRRGERKSVAPPGC